MINDVRVDVASFKKIDCNEDNYLKDNVEVFKEHYLYIPYDKTTPLCWYYAEGATPKNAYGWVPDALIPIEVCKTIPIMPYENQGFWVIYIYSKGRRRSRRIYQ